jgi:hypothetical protein
LLDWADRTNAFVVEDDYDAEYRNDRKPIGALQGLAPNRVIYVGTASPCCGAEFCGKRWVKVNSKTMPDLHLTIGHHYRRRQSRVP